ARGPACPRKTGPGNPLARRGTATCDTDRRSSRLAPAPRGLSQRTESPRGRQLHLEAVLAEPARRARVQRHVARGRLGLLAGRADALIRRPGVEPFPDD